MVLPYVYILTHKKTGHFYIGYRCKNVSLGRKSDNDIGYIYFTSSKLINSKNIEDYNITVIAEFFNSNDAYDFEQELIYQHWDNTLLINDHYHSGKTGRWKNSGHTSETRQKIRQSHIGKKRTEESKLNQSKASIGRVFSTAHRTNLSISKLGNKNPMFKNNPANKKYFSEDEIVLKKKEWNNTSYRNRKERCYSIDSDLGGKIPKAKKHYSLPSGARWYKKWAYDLAPTEFNNYIISNNIFWNELEV